VEAVNEKNIENQKRRRRRFPTHVVGATFLDIHVFFRARLNECSFGQARRSIRQDCHFLNTFLGMQKSIM
jgi:hypothetical protein